MYLNAFVKRHVWLRARMIRNACYTYASSSLIVPQLCCPPPSRFSTGFIPLKLEKKWKIQLRCAMPMVKSQSIFDKLLTPKFR